MPTATTAPPKAPPDFPRLLGYITELELEVDRLRRQAEYVGQEVGEGLQQLLRLCPDPAGGGEPTPVVAAAVRGLAALAHDLREPAADHPAPDRAVVIRVRCLADRAFRWQQRLSRNPDVLLRLDLGVEEVEWFPDRLRHILDNLFAHSLRCRTRVGAESWVFLGLRATAGGYEFRVSDNGLSPPDGGGLAAADLLAPGNPARHAGPGVGLSVVQLLVDQSGGTLSVGSDGWRGTEFVLSLPRYDVDDYLR